MDMIVAANVGMTQKKEKKAPLTYEQLVNKAYGLGYRDVQHNSFGGYQKGVYFFNQTGLYEWKENKKSSFFSFVPVVKIGKGITFEDILKELK